MPRLKTYKGKDLGIFLKQKKKKKDEGRQFSDFFSSPKLNFLYKKEVDKALVLKNQEEDVNSSSNSPLNPQIKNL